MMALSRCAESRDRWFGEVDVSPGEFVGIVLTALGANGFTYGAILYLFGVTNLATMAMLIGGGMLGLTAAVYLVVIYQIRDLVSR